MNTLNLTKRPMITVPETSQQMVNLFCMNAIEQAAIETDKAEFWEQRYNNLQEFVKNMKDMAEVQKYTDGSAYIRFEYISERYNRDLFDRIVSILKLGDEIMKLDKEENETENR